MKNMIAIFVMMAMIAASGCWGGTNVSPQGGIEPKDEGFRIIVPTLYTVAQDTGVTITVSLNRGAYFKRDVMMDVKSDAGISVTPANMLVKASDRPDVQLQIVVAREAALGEYKVSVMGTPSTGESTSTEFIVKVVTQ